VLLELAWLDPPLPYWLLMGLANEKELKYISPLCFQLYPVENAFGTAYQRIILKVKKLVEISISTEKYTFLSKYLNSIS
jgi:hypothetical protein